MNINKETKVSLSVLIPLLTFGFWFFNSKADKKDMEKAEEEIDINENINIEQTVLLEQLTKSVDYLNKKIDKELKE